jgi:hypothetical protein
VGVERVARVRVQVAVACIVPGEREAGEEEEEKKMNDGEERVFSFLKKNGGEKRNLQKICLLHSSVPALDASSAAASTAVSKDRKAEAAGPLSSSLSSH